MSAGSAEEMVAEMSSSMGEGMQLRQSLMDEILEIGGIVERDIPTQLSRAFDMASCPRVSAAYYEVKTPFCCDLIVAVYWMAYPLSVMGFCTLAAMFLTIFIGGKAFPGEVPENPSKKGKKKGDEEVGKVESKGNPVYDKE